MKIKKFNENVENKNLNDVNLINELNNTFDAVKIQLISDEKRWGDTWKERGLVYDGKDQETRWFEKMKEYYDNYIQKEGIIKDLGIFDSPDSFYSKFNQNLCFEKRFIYKRIGRHIINRNVDKIRKGT